MISITVPLVSGPLRRSYGLVVVFLIIIPFDPLFKGGKSRLESAFSQRTGDVPLCVRVGVARMLALVMAAVVISWSSLLLSHIAWSLYDHFLLFEVVCTRGISLLIPWPRTNNRLPVRRSFLSLRLDAQVLERLLKRGQLFIVDHTTEVGPRHRPRKGAVAGC